MKPQHKILLHKVNLLASEKISSCWDALLFFMGIPAIAKNDSSNVLLFVGEHLQTRIPRLAKWIKRKSDYTLILVSYKKGFVKEYSDSCFNNIYLFRNKWHLKRILKQITHISLVHGFATKSQFANIARVFLNKPYVHDMQDVFTIYYDKNTTFKWLKKELPNEAECLTQADGIVAHSMEVNPALRILKPVKKPKTIFFPLYCDNDFFQENAKTIDINNIHLVYAGGVVGSHRNPAQYGNIQFHGLIKTLTEQKLHFHIYPSPSHISADYEEYKQLDKDNPYFHFHAPVPQQQLAKELSKYHFGILPFFKSLSQQSDLKLKYATTLKLFNYLEAGIPVIISEDIIYQNWILNRYGAAININEKNIKALREKIIQSNYGEFKENINKNREIISIGKNIDRLIHFYSTIVKK